MRQIFLDFFLLPNPKKQRWVQKISKNITKADLPITHGIIHVTEKAKIHSNLENSTTHCGPRSISPQLSNLTHSANLQERQFQKKKHLMAPFSPLFLLQNRHHIFCLLPIFSASLRSIWQRQEEQVCTQSQWRTCRRRCLRLHPLFSKIPLLLPQKTTVFTRTNRENPVNSDL